jgi:hypothetical protein
MAYTNCAYVRSSNELHAMRCDAKVVASRFRVYLLLHTGYCTVLVVIVNVAAISASFHLDLFQVSNFLDPLSSLRVRRQVGRMGP